MSDDAGRSAAEARRPTGARGRRPDRGSGDRPRYARSRWRPTGAPGPVAPPSGPSAPRAHRHPGRPALPSGGLWVGLILSALVLLLLLVFILQNGDPVQISFFAFEGVLPTGVALLLAAIAGILLVAIPGSLRIMQLRRAARRGTRPGR